MQGARRWCRWCRGAPGNESHDSPLPNEEIRHLREAVRLSRNPLLFAVLNNCSDAFDRFNFFNFDAFDLPSAFSENSATYVRRVWCGPCLLIGVPEKGASRVELL